MANVQYPGLSYDFCEAWCKICSQGRIVHGYLTIHRERCVKYREMKQAGTGNQTAPEDASGHSQRTEPVNSLVAQNLQEYEDSAPEPPCIFKCDICGLEGKASGDFHPGKLDHLLTHQESASADLFPQRKRPMKNLHHTDPLLRDTHSYLPTPKLSHDPNADSHSPLVWREAGLTTRELEQLIDTVYEEDLVRECICLHMIERGQKVKTLPCGHAFHSKCIVPALIETGVCPVDKSKVL